MTNAKRQPDFALFVITIILLVIGVFMVYDASYAVASQERNNPNYYFYRQAGFAVIGVILMFLVMKIPYWRLRPYAGIFLGLSVFCLLLVFVPGIGKESNGAKRWLMLGGQQFQPSEFAKLCLVLYLASYLSSKKRDIRDFQSGFLPLAVPIAIVSVLIVKEDMGTSIVVMVTAVAMIFMAGGQVRHIVGALGVVFPVALGFILHESYRLHRIVAFFNPFSDYHGKGYQVCQSLIALGSGGVFGVGICESRQKLFYLPAGHTDFIYAVFGQETGLIGTVALAVLFFLFAARGFSIAYRTKDDFGRYLAAGISIMIASQALLNMLVVTSSVPNTGVPLPFISYGGSSLALNLICAGIVLGISQNKYVPHGRREIKK